MGPAPIGYRDLKAWSEIMGEYPKGWELKAIFAMDRAFMVSVKNNQPEKPEKPRR